MAITANSFLLEEDKKTAQRTGATYLSQGAISRLNNQHKTDAQKAYELQSTNNGGFLGGLGYLGEKVGLGFLSGIEGIWDYGAGGIAKLFGADNWAEQQFANDWVNYNDADEWYNPSDGWRFAGDVAGGIGTSLPAIAGVAAGAAIAYFSGGTLTPLAAGIISGSIAGLGAAGNATKEAYRETGVLDGKAFGYGALSGATEAGVEFLSAGLAIGSGRIVSSIAKTTAKETTETIAKTGAKTVIKNLVTDFASEAFEEGLSEVLSPVYQRLTYNPDAKNATPQEVAYAALVGGLSGLVMSGGHTAIGAGINTTENFLSGKNAVENGSAASIIDTARQLAETESKNDTGYVPFQIIIEDYAKLTASLAETGGTVTTAKQKMLLGELKRANTAAIFMPFVERSAINILNNADTVAQRFTEFGMKDASGNPLTFSADAIRSGIDTALLSVPVAQRTKAQSKALVKSIRAALSSNSTLATLAVADATGHITMDTQKIAEAMLNGSNLVDSNTLNYFMENAKKDEIAAASADLGISDWSALTLDELKTRAGEFTTSERGSEVMKQKDRIRSAMEATKESTKALPHILRGNMTDGVYRFSSATSDVNMAVIKDGTTYHLYDYDSGNISRSLTVQEVNKVLRTYWNTQGTAVSANATQSIVQERTAEMFEGQKSDIAQQTAEIDTFATEKIPEYRKLSEPNKQAVRMTIRQAQKYGIDSEIYTTMARVAARSGMNIVFDSEGAGAGNAKTSGNTVYIDPNAPADRMRSKLLLHEAGHILFRTKDGKKLLEQAFKQADASTAQRVAQQYISLYEKAGMSAEEYTPIVAEEISARSIEDILGSDSAWEYILAEEPTAGEKFLSFFRKAARDYSADEKMSAEARKLLRKYKKMFSAFTAQNQQNNALELTLQDSAGKMQSPVRYALKKDKFGTLYVDVDEETIGKEADVKQVASALSEIVRTRFTDFIKVQGQTIGINQRAANEWVYSENAKALRRFSKDVFIDKANAFGNADELLKAARDYIGEETKHKRKDNFKEFARGVVAFQVGGRGYEADIIVGTTKSGVALLYDVVNIQGKKIEADTTDTAQDRRQEVSTTVGTPATTLDEQASNNTPEAISGTDSTDSIHQNAEKSNSISENNSENAKKGADSGERFALSIGGEDVAVDVEQTKNLVAIHNLTEKNLLDTLKLGGFPMPSIAVVKVDMGHSDYGDISVVFGKETIDPLASQYNKLYGGDAWTPVYPRIDYEASDRVVSNISDMFYRLQNEFGRDLADPLYDYVYDAETKLSNYKGENGIIEALRDNEKMMRVFLADTQGKIVEKTQKEVRHEMPATDVQLNEYFIKELGMEFFDSITQNGDAPLFSYRREWAKANKPKYLEAYKKFFADNFGFTAEQQENIVQNISDKDFIDRVKSVRRYNSEGAVKIEIVTDIEASSKALREAVETTAYERWLHDTFDGIEADRGIYNGKDYYTPMGNKRSFSYTHLEENLENVVKMMRQGKNGDAVFGGQGIWGVSAKDYTSIDEMKADTSRLGRASETDYKAKREEYTERLYQITKSIDNKSSDNEIISLDNAATSVVDALRQSKNAGEVFRILHKSYPKMTLSIANDIVKLATDIANMPTEYFEAKPLRAVEFSEIKTILLPDTVSERLTSELDSRGIRYEKYGTTDAERANRLKNLEDVRFALPSDKEYLSAVESGDTKLQQQMVDTAAVSWGAYLNDEKGNDVFPQTGKARIFYHGTRENFTVFDPRMIGSASGDLGYFGKGHYFAFGKGEASYYATSRGKVIPAYLQMRNPYIYENLYKYRGEQAKGIMGASDAVWAVNMVENFPKLVEDQTVEYAERNDDNIKEMSFSEFAKLFDKIADSVEFTVEKVGGNGEECYIICADATDEVYTDASGKEHKYRDYGFQQRFYDEKSASSKATQVYTYLENRYFSYLELPRPARIIQDMGLSDALREMGYDGILQSEYGDEAVVFDSNQIKSAEPVTYDDNGKVIPLSERFQTRNDDIRYALPETDSNGTPLSEQQREYFADTKVVDSNGHLLLVYHGTRDANFTEFRRNMIYFTDSAEMADSYSPKGERYAGYLNITKPFVVDAGGAKWSGIPVDAETKAFLDKYGSSTFKEAGKWRTTPADIAAAIEEAIDDGSADYDGIIIQNVDDTGSYYKKNDSVIGNDYIAFNSNQFKNADNKAPTADKDIRYALDDPFLDDFYADVDGAENAQNGDFDAEAIIARGMPRRAGEASLTVGELRKIIANNTRQKVYSKKDAISVVKRFAGVSELSAKTKSQIADAVWQILNESPDIAYRRDVAHDMAEFIVAKIIVDSKTVNPDAEQARENLSYLRTGIGRLSFSPEDISEIRHIRDKDGLRRVLGRWGYKGSRKSGDTSGVTAPRRIPMDVFVTDIAREMPAMEYLEDMHPAEAFMEIDSMYEKAREGAKDKWISSYWDMPDSEIPSMIKSVEDTIMQAYESEGEQSKFSRLVENKIGYYAERAKYWKTEYDKLNGRSRMLGLLMSKAQQMKDLRLGTFANSTQHDSEVFKNSIEKLAKIQFRGNLNVTGTRKILAELRSWYRKDNQILEYVDEKNSGYFVQGVADMLDELANGEKGFTKEDLSNLYDVMSYFVNFVENWGKVFRQGKWIDAEPEARRYIDTLHANQQVKVGLFKKLAGTTYAQTFFDPMTVARRMDMYESGFYTEMMSDLRDAATDAQVAEMELRSAYDEFNSKNKKYVQTASTETVEYRGVQIQKLHLISLYMTMKRKHARAGLVLNGFSFRGVDGNTVRVNGVVAPDSKLTDAEVEQYSKEQISAIEKLLTDTDKQYIAILEQAFNVDARKLKADRDMQRLGFTNATNDYYYPIRRGNIAKNVDTSDVAGELDRVSSASFNKDTVTGAKQELYIESADAVFNRHIHAVCQYAHLSPAIETYNRLFNLDISGNKNKPISVSTESQNTWDKGNKYFVKLISDIQGIPASSSEGMAALSFIRSGYAKYQLGANPKVWFTQLSSLFASSSILDADSIARGMAVSSKGIDEYCSLAKLRNNDNTAAMAQGVLDGVAKRAVSKIGKFSDILMAPIGKMDRFVVCRLFGACQIQVQKNGGAKVGTEANKIEAGKLLRRVILETQQNSIATERSAAMRSGNEIMRTLTMFTSDSMKVVGRVIDAYGEFSTLKSKLKMATDAGVKAELKTKIGAARKRFAKSVGALVTSAAFMAAIAQLFRHIYDKEPKEDETVAKTMVVDAVGNLFGGLPIIKDVVSRLTDGYSIDNYAYSAVNDLLDSAINLASVADGLFSNEKTSQDRNRAVRNLAYSVGQLFGIPTRNVYNALYGLTKRFNPEVAYKIDNSLYKKNYQNELYKAIEAEDTEKATMIMSLLLGERVSGDIDDAVFDELFELSQNGQKVIPRTVPDKITVGEMDYELSATEQSAVKELYSDSQKTLHALFTNSRYKNLDSEQKAQAIEFVYQTYYDKALENALGIDRNNGSLLIADEIGIQNLALFYVTTKGIESDKDKDGNSISGSKRNKVVSAINALGINNQQKMLLICARGYALKDGDIRGLTAKKAKKLLLQYILSMKGKTREQKAAIADMCGFEVKNGRIITKNLELQNKW